MLHLRHFTRVWLAPAVLIVLGVSSVARAARVEGIDVSQFQGTMNWNTAYNQDVRFAFVRSSRGGTTAAGASHTDTRIHQNMTAINALAASGKKIYAGAYHYGRPDTIGSTLTTATIQAHARDQAQHFYNVAAPYMTPGYLRPVLDLEETGGTDDGVTVTPATPNLSKAQLSLWANTFMDHVESLSGVEPPVYMNTNYATNEIDSSMSGRDLWLANWNMTTYGNPVTGTGNPPTGVFGAGNWEFWQYDSPNGLGSTYGAQSVDLDLNVANGDINFVRSFVIPEPGTATLALILGALHLTHRRRTSR